MKKKRNYFISLEIFPILKNLIKNNIFFKIYNQYKDNKKNKKYFMKLHNHEVMLADLKRTQTYIEVLDKYIDKKDIILDCGSGTGLLSLIASRNNPKKIYAIEQTNIINIGKKLAYINKIQNIDFIQINSKKFKSNQKISMIIHEQIGNAIFDENMVSNIIDLRDRLLIKNGKIIPNIFELYLEPISLNDSYRIPKIYEKNLIDINFTKLEDFIKSNFKEINFRILPRKAIKNILSSPSKIFSFNLNSIKDQNEITKFFKIERTVVPYREIDGFCIFFKAKFENEVIYDTIDFNFSHPMAWGIPFYRISPNSIKTPFIKYSLFINDIFDPSKWEVKIRN